MNKRFRFDYYRIKEEYLKNKLLPIKILFYPRLFFVYLCRFSEGYGKVKKLIKLISKFYGRKYGLGFQTDYIQAGLSLGHAFCITINDECIIGKNFTIHKDATVRQTSRGLIKGVPVVGNDVWVGSNAPIVSRISIGDDVLIAPNTFVNVDVPSNSVVYGNPGIIKSAPHATKDYIINRIEEIEYDS